MFTPNSFYLPGNTWLHRLHPLTKLTFSLAATVIIFGGPTAGLDAREQEQLGQVIASLHQQGKTIVMISHDMDFLVENLDRFVLLRSGQIILDAPARDFFVQKAALEACGMISPQITRLSQYLKLPQLALSVEHFLDCLT